MERLAATSALLPDALRVDGLCKRFRATVALDGIGFRVPEASLTVLLGPAGSGKTTTLRTIAGLERQDSGQVWMQGRDAGTLEPRERDIAMIFDNLALYPDKTAFENIASPLKVRGVPAAETEARVKEMAGTLRIAPLLHRLPKTMSGGERQRVALGRALVRKPALCLLDEPLSSLDAMLRVELRAELRRLQRELGYSFLLATPDYAEALAVADTVVMLRKGRVVQTCAAQTLYDAPADRETARFVGAPEINLLAARFEPASGLMPAVIRAAGGTMAASAGLVSALTGSGREFELGVRPECLRVVDRNAAAAVAEVIDVEPLGLKAVLTVRNAEAEMRVVTEARTARRIGLGENVGLAFDGARLLAFDRASGARLVSTSTANNESET